MAQHSIKGVFTPPEDYRVAVLYKVTPTISEYITHAEVDKKGNFEIPLDSTVTKGMYRIVYAIPEEDYNFDIIYNKKEDISLTFNSETGLKILSSSENKLMSSYTNSMSMITHSINNYYRDKSEDTLALVSIFKTQREAQKGFEDLAKNTIALAFIKANKPYIPKHYEDVETYSKNVKTHYFDHVNFTNKTLQSSNFLNERMVNYVFGVVTDSINREANYKENINVFCEAMKEAPIQIKRTLLVDLWEQMRDLNYEKTANYISDTYLINIAKKLNDTALVDGLTLYRNISIGKVAPDFAFDVEKDGVKRSKKLSELTGVKNYILVFWNSTCAHCLDEIPQLEAFIKDKKKEDITVIAIGLEDSPEYWNRVVKRLPDFIHVYGAGYWDNDIGNSYGVTATPSYFVLDKDKHIVAKPDDIDVLKLYFESQKNKEKNKASQK
ncbi:TlpA disulfide reductase family protein [Aestuariibaculum sp. YM273]|uniref:TlpA family protein disulfide reductase n=1 Tax=Aestuariibaculum sp. YM273 TaxID=3070659 RepID=UPI0027DE1208|nr:TlpA disulfide reductase family protein [Aestuariibaculum sp. YM273]WMI66533.1 TlpA disulfide reductase family protein [Aestuariibaculum sp. YM273]